MTAIVHDPAGMAQKGMHQGLHDTVHCRKSPKPEAKARNKNGQF